MATEDDRPHSPDRPYRRLAAAVLRQALDDALSGDLGAWSWLHSDGPVLWLAVCDLVPECLVGWCREHEGEVLAAVATRCRYRGLPTGKRFPRFSWVVPRWVLVAVSAVNVAETVSATLYPGGRVCLHVWLGRARRTPGLGSGVGGKRNGRHSVARFMTPTRPTTNGNRLRLRVQRLVNLLPPDSSRRKPGLVSGILGKWGNRFPIFLWSARTSPRLRMQRRVNLLPAGQ